MIKRKVLQKVNCWRYPCDGKILYFDNDRFLEICPRPVPTPDILQVDCPCGKYCKPEKIQVVVFRIL